MFPVAVPDPPVSSCPAVCPADGESGPERWRGDGPPQAAAVRPEHGPTGRHRAVRH